MTSTDVLTVTGARKRFGGVPALDGYLKVFWRDAPLLALWPQVLVLAALTLMCLTLARTFARRCERG